MMRPKAVVCRFFFVLGSMTVGAGNAAAQPAASPPPTAREPIASYAAPGAAEGSNPTAPSGPVAAGEDSPPVVESGSDWMLGMGIASSLFGVGFFVVSVYAAFRVGDIGRDDGYAAYRDGTRASDETCDSAEAGVVVPGAPSPAEIEEMCGEAATFEAVQAVTIPLNILLGVVGIVLISQSDTVKGTADEAPATPIVAISPAGGFVGVRMPF